MSWSFFLRHQAFCDEKAVCRYAQRRVVVKAAPAAPLEMPQAKFLLELLVIALNTPAQFCESHEFLDWRISRLCTECFQACGDSSRCLCGRRGRGICPEPGHSVPDKCAHLI